MKPEAQRIAIATTLGWWRSTGFGGVGSMHSPTCSCFDGAECVIPDYLNDLNEIAKMEKMLTGGKSSDYAIQLFSVTGAPVVADRTWHEISRAITATAAQRAEAFLRTIGKWEDDK